jgi:hypothetical protein
MPRIRKLSEMYVGDVEFKDCQKGLIWQKYLVCNFESAIWENGNASSGLKISCRGWEKPRVRF